MFLLTGKTLLEEEFSTFPLEIILTLLSNALYMCVCVYACEYVCIHYDTDHVWKSKENL